MTPFKTCVYGGAKPKRLERVTLVICYIAHQEEVGTKKDILANSCFRAVVDGTELGQVYGVLIVK